MYGVTNNNHPDHLGKQSFSSGRFYYEVQVKGNTDWDLGVARQSINRKEEIRASIEKGFWAIGMTHGAYYIALDGSADSLPLSPWLEEEEEEEDGRDGYCW